MKLKRTVCVILSLVMLLSIVPMASAADKDNEIIYGEAIPINPAGPGDIIGELGGGDISDILGELGPGDIGGLIGDLSGINHEHDYVGGVCSLCRHSILSPEWLAPNFAEGDYTIIAIPDTQSMVKYWSTDYMAQMQWIADNKENLNIQAVIHMGDMVQDDDATQWSMAKIGTSYLDNAGVVWMPMRGNHDNSDMFNKNYPYSTYGTGRSYFGGSYDGKTLDHYYCVITVGEREYVFLNLGWMPTVMVLNWAKGVVEEHSDKNVIISCHAYMNKDGTPLSWATDMSESMKNELLANLPNGVTMEMAMQLIPDGDAIWNAFKGYENVVLALSGHVHSADIVTFTDKNGAGRNVSSLLIDRQNDDVAQPLGMLAVLSFREDSDKVAVNWYSTEYDAFYKASNQFEITVPHVAAADGHTHSFADKKVVAPTCTEMGYTLYTCSCGESEKDNYVSASGHNWDEGVYVEANRKTFTCLTCGAKVENFLVDDKHEHSYTSVVTAPGCGAMGYTTHTCSCGDVKVTTYVDALEHVWGEGKVSVVATEEKEGLLVYSCNLCGEKREEVIPKVEHIHVYSDTVVAPTCEEKGYTQHICRCGDSYNDAEVAALGHKWNEGEVTLEPTKEAEGEKTYTCSVCKGKKTESIEKLPDECLKGHKWDKGTVSIEATNEAEGEMLYTCKACGEEKTEVIAKLPNVKDFDDIVTGDYFYTPVKWALAEAVANGTPEGKFLPYDECKRKDVVTLLWRAAGQPDPISTENPFTDVKADDYFYSAVLWAVENGITTGVSANKFGPNQTCTRAQVVTFLWRSAEKPMAENAENPFKDVNEEHYFYDAVLWAVENEITTGMNSNTFGYGAKCTRAQIVTFLYRTFN